MFDLLDEDDAPIWARNDQQPPEAPVTVGQINHHANHVLFLSGAATAVGLEGVFYMPRLGIEDPSGEPAIEFLLRHLDPG